MEKIRPVIRFNNRIYKKQALLKGVAVYSGLAEFRIKNNKKYYEVFISGADNRPGNSLASEFANYVLAMTKKCL